MNRKLHLLVNSIIIIFITILIIGCNEENGEEIVPKNPDTAPKAIVDRFSDSAAVLMKRSDNSELPASNVAIHFDKPPFITQSFGPDGNIVKYYNFDVQPLAPAPLYVLYKEGSDTPVEEQLNIINVIPGDIGYNDFWRVYKVTVPTNYVANTIASYFDIIKENYVIKVTDILVNCPVVPFGSTAELGNDGLHAGWYKDEVIYYFSFEEKDLNTTNAGLVPVSPIYVTFNINPDENNPNSGPPSGFVTETNTMQTHNIVATLPADDDYSPLWIVNIYDNADFDNVINLATALSATILVNGAATVNCPVVYIEE